MEGQFQACSTSCAACRQAAATVLWCIAWSSEESCEHVHAPDPKLFQLTELLEASIEGYRTFWDEEHLPDEVMSQALASIIHNLLDKSSSPDYCWPPASKTIMIHHPGVVILLAELLTSDNQEVRSAALGALQALQEQVAGANAEDNMSVIAPGDAAVEAATQPQQLLQEMLNTAAYSTDVKTGLKWVVTRLLNCSASCCEVRAVAQQVEGALHDDAENDSSSCSSCSCELMTTAVA
jgi:hypothetical protein